MRKTSPAARRSLAAIIAAAAVAVPAAGVSASTVSAPAAVAAPARYAATTAPVARGAALHALCHSAGPIVANALPATVELASCPIQGRQLVLRLLDGHLGAGIYVPPPGHTEGNDLLTTRGEYNLEVTNSGGRLSIRVATPARQTARIPHVTREDAACHESRWEDLHLRQYKTVYWYYNQTTAVNRAHLSASASLADIRAASTNMTVGVNNCGFSQVGFAAYGSYSGTTNLYANIDSSGNCTGNYPDGQNTVSWGPLESGHVADTCYGGEDGAMGETDTYIGSDQGVVDNLPAGCTDNFDLQTIMTHEWGHVFGLQHFFNDTANSALVMYGEAVPCNVRRHLGLGDYNGMGFKYGPR
jgi:hypothetical protein